MRFFAFLPLVVFFISSCSIAPLTSTKTARTLGEGNWEINTGLSPAVTLSAGRGFSENFDAGLILESQLFAEIALWGKYSFKNTKNKDFSFSLYGGVFQAVDFTSSSGIFVGPIISYKHNWFESYFITRYNWVHWEARSLNSEERDDSYFDKLSWDSEEINYLQYTLGMNFWFTEGFGLNVSGTYFSFFKESIEVKNVLPGIELMWRF